MRTKVKQSLWKPAGNSQFGTLPRSKAGGSLRPRPRNWATTTPPANSAVMRSAGANWREFTSAFYPRVTRGIFAGCDLSSFRRRLKTPHSINGFLPARSEVWLMKADQVPLRRPRAEDVEDFAWFRLHEILERPADASRSDLTGGALVNLAIVEQRHVAHSTSRTAANLDHIEI